MAEAPLANGKKALGFARQFLQNNERLPSGKTAQNLLQYVRNKKRTGEDKQPIPEKWVFSVYMTFVLFACHILTSKEERLQVYCTQGEKEGKSASRAYARKKQKQEQSGTRGISMEQLLVGRHITTKEVAILQKEIAVHTKQTYAKIQALEVGIQSVIAQRFIQNVSNSWNGGEQMYFKS